MSVFSRIDRHARLVERMADTVGVDLAEESLRGRMPPQEYRAAVLRCTGCSQVDACCSWLEAHPDGAVAPPDYCRNKITFERSAQR